jgi:hypothetical protein
VASYTRTGAETLKSLPVLLLSLLAGVLQPMLYSISSVDLTQSPPQRAFFVQKKNPAARTSALMTTNIQFSPVPFIPRGYLISSRAIFLDRSRAEGATILRCCCT